jgi:hypothetical protein
LHRAGTRRVNISTEVTPELLMKIGMLKCYEVTHKASDLDGLFGIKVKQLGALKREWEDNIKTDI